ncbi:MAG: hypothetical protein KGQ57_18390, partial [Burkholderiales bacterium]|nr:hypothetical protein [Burkholderiales bacterium]
RIVMETMRVRPRPARAAPPTAEPTQPARRAWRAENKKAPEGALCTVLPVLTVGRDVDDATSDLDLRAANAAVGAAPYSKIVVS